MDQQPAASNSNTAPAPALVIFDLDETLIHAVPAAEDRPETGEALVMGESMPPYRLHRRPFLREALESAARHAAVAIWTAAAADYAQEVVARILPPGIELAFLWSRQRCTLRRDAETLERTWLKDLKKVKRRGWDLERVLIIEDDVAKVARHLGNWLPVRPFEGDPADRELELLARALPRILAHPTLRQLPKRTWREDWGGRDVF